MPNLNELTIIGHVGREPTMTVGKSGKMFAKFSVAVSNGKDKPATWFSVTCFEKQAENAVDWIKKGDAVMVRGPVSVSTWDKYGTTNVSLDVIGYLIKSLSPRERTPTQQEALGKTTSLDADIPF